MHCYKYRTVKPALNNDLLDLMSSCAFDPYSKLQQSAQQSKETQWTYSTLLGQG